MKHPIRASFRFAAYALLAAAFAAAAPDCAQSVAFAQLHFSSCMDWLSLLGAEPFFAAQTGFFMRSIDGLLRFLPFWAALALAALLFYRLSAAHFPTHRLRRRRRPLR